MSAPSPLPAPGTRLRDVDSQVARIVGIPLGAARLYLARLALRDRADRPTRYGAPWRSRPAYLQEKP